VALPNSVVPLLSVVVRRHEHAHFCNQQLNSNHRKGRSYSRVQERVRRLCIFIAFELEPLSKHFI
jgi:hypothetical protein